MDDTPNDPKWTNVAVGVTSGESNGSRLHDGSVPNVKDHDHSAAGYRWANLNNSGVLGYHSHYGYAYEGGGNGGVGFLFDSVSLLVPDVMGVGIRVFVSPVG